MVTEAFDSCVRTTGDFAGVFEYDGETGYFYLCETKGSAVERIIDSTRVLAGAPDCGAPVSVRWDCREEKVGLFIRGALWAVFDVAHHTKYGESYQAGARPSLPSEARLGFDLPLDSPRRGHL